MKRHSVKASALVLSALLLFGAQPVTVSAAFNHAPYWPLQSALNKATQENDDDKLLEACEGIVELYADFPDLDASLRVESPARKAAIIYEKRGQFDDALRMYHVYKESLVVRQQFSTEDVRERLLYADSFIDAYRYAEPVVYAYADSPADVPYFGAPNEPETGTYVGMCNTNGSDYDESLNNGYLLYATFEAESFRSFDYLLPKTDSYYLLEAAWNLADKYTAYGAIEYLDRIANGEFDTYIKNELGYLGGLRDCGVLLRFAAEVNVWDVNTSYYWGGQLDQFKETYIAAFRHVHDLAEAHAPNVAMVYSPNDISNMYVTHEDFYPGDDYVDWVGISSYCNLSDDATGEHGNMPDAYYKRGVYENQLIKVGDIVDTYGDRKTIVISECGFMYHSASSRQTVEHAEAGMKNFYTYVNMLFPEVKAVFYFNSNHNGNEYCLFGYGRFTDNSTLAKVYRDTVLGNPVMAGTLSGKSGGYTRFETLHEKRDELNLAVYAAYPGNPSMTVTYQLDGKEIASVQTMPYSCRIPSDLLTPGSHGLTVRTQAGESKYEKQFSFVVTADGVIMAGGSAPEGDLTGDYSVDILDAILLFRYTMLPQMYPIDYEGNMDYVKDGEINIADAIYLFRYSMMPDLYPLG